MTKTLKGWAVINWRNQIEDDGHWGRFMIYRSQRSARIAAKGETDAKIAKVEIRRP